MTNPSGNTLGHKFKSAMFQLPAMMRCDALELQIDDYLDQNLTWAQRLKFELHLKICSDCRAYLAAYQRSIAVSGALFDVPYTQMGLGEMSETLVRDVLARSQAQASKDDV